jgi:hypothetical protein
MHEQSSCTIDNSIASPGFQDELLILHSSPALEVQSNHSRESTLRWRDFSYTALFESYELGVGVVVVVVVVTGRFGPPGLKGSLVSANT